jgi:voltage-gated potassium channel
VRATDSRTVRAELDAQSLGEQRIRRWDDRARPWIILAALIPIIATVTSQREGVLLVIDIVAWLIFLADLVVHIRNRPRFLRSGIGMFDLAIVIATFPWYIIPGLESTDVIMLARLARVARLFMEGSHTRPVRLLVQRLGRSFLYAALLLLVCTLVVNNVEGGKNGFTDFGDSLWWGVVTITTVGYGDLVPETTAGRAVAVVLMLGGLALLGALAGSLSAFLRVKDTSDDDASAAASRTAAGVAEHDVGTELAALRKEVAQLTRRIGELQQRPHTGPP